MKSILSDAEILDSFYYVGDLINSGRGCSESIVSRVRKHSRSFYLQKKKRIVICIVCWMCNVNVDRPQTSYKKELGIKGNICSV